jgi:hypothetical protein
MFAASIAQLSKAANPCPLRGSTVKCGGCSKAFSAGEWLSLPLVAVLTGDAIAAHVLRWPHGVRIQIRRCERCGRPIARTGA